MSQAGDVLRRAAADVEVRGVVREPERSNDETCALLSIEDADDALAGAHFDAAVNALAATIGRDQVADWNDSQPSRAVVAASMREAADLADLLYGGDAG